MFVNCDASLIFLNVDNKLPSKSYCLITDNRNEEFAFCISSSFNSLVLNFQIKKLDDFCLPKQAADMFSAL